MAILLKLINFLLILTYRLFGFLVMLFMGITCAISLKLLFEDGGYFTFLENLSNDRTFTLYFSISLILLTLITYFFSKIVNENLANYYIEKKLNISPLEKINPILNIDLIKGCKGPDYYSYNIDIHNENYILNIYDGKLLKLNNGKIEKIPLPRCNVEATLEKKSHVDNFYQKFIASDIYLLTIQSILFERKYILNKTDNSFIFIFDSSEKTPILTLFNWIFILIIFTCIILSYILLLGDPFSRFLIIPSIGTILLALKMFSFQAAFENDYLNEEIVNLYLDKK